MKTPLFILNIVSAILLITLAFLNPTITGLTVNLADPKITLASPLGFATIFIITTISLDIYYYLKNKKE